MSKKSSIEKWRESLTPEQWAEHQRKMEEARAAKYLANSPFEREAKALLREYLEALQCLTGGGEPTLNYCQLCVGSGIHTTAMECGCLCHRTRALLSKHDDEMQNLR